MITLLRVRSLAVFGWHSTPSPSAALPSSTQRYRPGLGRGAPFDLLERSSASPRPESHHQPPSAILNRRRRRVAPVATDLRCECDKRALSILAEPAIAISVPQSPDTKGLMATEALSQCDKHALSIFAEQATSISPPSLIARDSWRQKPCHNVTNMRCPFSLSKLPLFRRHPLIPRDSWRQNTVLRM